MTRLGSPLPKKFSGDFVGRVTSVPIPNTEVKPAGADGTARETVWESRKSAGLLIEGPLNSFRRAFVLLLRDFDITSRIPLEFSESHKLLFSGTSKLVKIPPICGAPDVRVPEFNVATTIRRLCSGWPVCMNFFALTVVWTSQVSIRSADYSELQPRRLQP